jgi:hypothetical protein
MINNQIHKSPPEGVPTIFKNEVRPKTTTINMTFDKEFDHQYQLTVGSVKNKIGYDLVVLTGNLDKANGFLAEVREDVYSYIFGEYPHFNAESRKTIEHKLACHPDSYVTIMNAMLNYTRSAITTNVLAIKDWTGVNMESGIVTELPSETMPDGTKSVLKQGGLLNEAKFTWNISDVQYRSDY